MNQKEPDAFASGSFLNLVQNIDVRRLQTFRALLDVELDLLAFLQVTETIALDGGEMDENVRTSNAFENSCKIIA